MRYILATSALALVVLSSAAGQSKNDRLGASGNPAGTEPGTAGPGISAHKANQPDRVFLTMINMASAAEVEFARLAEQKSQDEQVRNFAQRMIHDHSEADDEVGKLARTDDVHLGDHQLDPDHKQAYDGLTHLAGPEFDIEYMRLQVQDHQRAVQLLEYEIGSGEDVDVTSFASRTLPIIFTHLRLGRDLLAKVSAQYPQIASAPPKVSGQPTPSTPPPRHETK